MAYRLSSNRQPGIKKANKGKSKKSSRKWPATWPELWKAYNNKVGKFADKMDKEERTLSNVES